MKWFIKVIKNFSFSGRARRKEYWMFALFAILILFSLGVLDMVLGTYSDTSKLGLLSGIFMLVILIQNLTAWVRRLHDIGLSGWWILISFIPYIGPIIWLVLMLLEGQQGGNQYGPDPKQTA